MMKSDMRKKVLAVALAFLSILASLVFAADPLLPEQVAQFTYDRYLGDDMQMNGTMELTSRSDHVRSREFISLRKDSNAERKQLIRFTAPADIDGTAFLTFDADNSSDTEQHLYLPALKRTRRIVASQQGRSFVNSDFTYEDMQRHRVEAWDYRLDGEDTFSGYPCYVLVSTPKPDTDTQYGKMTSWIEKEHFIPLQTIFWDKNGQQSKSYTVNSFAMIDNIATETDVVMEDLHSGHKTRLKTFEIKYNSGLQDALFTTRALER
ncbi:MAG: outer membrane lipoprotein-sorting protein [Desulfuromonadales bacterium]